MHLVVGPLQAPGVRATKQKCQGGWAGSEPSLGGGEIPRPTAFTRNGPGVPASTTQAPILRFHVKQPPKRTFRIIKGSDFMVVHAVDSGARRRLKELLKQLEEEVDDEEEVPTTGQPWDPQG